MEAARYERCATVSQALTLLRLEWATVLGEIEAAFNFGVLAGTEIERLSNALNVVITVEEPQVQTNAGTTPRWRPRFRYCDGGIQQVLGIPADRLAAHRNVMLVSYLLRASADYALKWVMPDPVHRNSVVRDEVDFLMFGTFPKFARRLADFGSLEAVHSADIPLQLVGGYLTKHIPSASLESFLAATPYYGYESGAVLPSVGKAVRRIGSGPSFRSHLGVCRAWGRACVEAGKGLSLGAKHSHAWRHGAHSQRRLSPFPASTRRAGAIFGAIRRCRLVVGGSPTPRRRLGWHRNSPRRRPDPKPDRLLALQQTNFYAF